MQMQRVFVLLAVGLTLAAAQPFLSGQNLLPGGENQHYAAANSS